MFRCETRAHVINMSCEFSKSLELPWIMVVDPFFFFFFVVDTILSSNDIDTNTKWKIDRRCFVEANSLNLNFEWMKGKCARDSRLRSNSHRSDRDHGRTIVRRSRIFSRFVEVSLEGVSLHENRSCTLSTTTNLFYF